MHMGCHSSHWAFIAAAIAAGASLATAEAPEGYAYNCAVGLDVWKYTWSRSKRAYCCEHEQKACEAATTSLKAQESYSCSPGSVGEMGVAQRAWCCVHHSVGCPHIDAAGIKVAGSLTEPFDPNAVKEHTTALGTGEEAAPPIRAAQDARFISSSTTTTTTTTTSTNTRTVTENRENTTAEKIEATTTRISTTTFRTTSTTQSYNCRRALSHWMTAWSMEKKEWCCMKHRAGCLRGALGAARERHFNCKAGFWTCQEGWSEEKTTWCWKHKGIVCGVDSYAWIFDCSAGYPNWRAGWSEPKKAWCCRHYTLGCERHTTTTTTLKAEFDCNEDFDSFVTAWSPEKKTWCCRHFQMGCQNLIAVTTTVTTTQFHDCEAGGPNAKNAWSKAKQDWCCTHGGRGCTSAQYNCEENSQDWEASWSVNKKFYCCTTAGLGCPSGANFSMAMAKYSQPAAPAVTTPTVEALQGRPVAAVASAVRKLAIACTLLGAAVLVVLRRHRRVIPLEPEVVNPFITDTASS